LEDEKKKKKRNGKKVKAFRILNQRPEEGELIIESNALRHADKELTADRPAVDCPAAGAEELRLNLKYFYCK
jgi:hypothetical protein